jgi:hypothetical protein
MVSLRIFIDQQGQAKDMISIFDTLKWYYTLAFVSELQDAAAYNRLIYDKIVIWESANQRDMIHVYKVKTIKSYSFKYIPHLHRLKVYSCTAELFLWESHTQSCIYLTQSFGSRHQL